MEGVKTKTIWVFLKIDSSSYMNKTRWKSFLRIYTRCVVGMGLLNAFEGRMY